jgi:hypothetical protein
VIEFFISIPMELKIIILAGLFIGVLDYIKRFFLKLVRKEDKNVKEENK